MEIGLKTQAGHVASAMSCVDLLCILYNKFPNEVIILSKGHGALAQYVILNELGKLSDAELETYQKDGGLSEHTTLNRDHGIFASTGSLGHGLGIGVGYALADPKKNVYVVIGDGELDEGSTHEALRIITRLKLKNIFVFVDTNDWSGLGNATGIVPYMMRPFYSVKGEGWGKVENTLASHYTSVSQEVFDTWTKNSVLIEEKRLKNIEDYKKTKETR